MNIANLEAYPVSQDLIGTMRSLYIYANNIKMATFLCWREPPKKKSRFTKSEKQSPSYQTESQKNTNPKNYNKKKIEIETAEGRRFEDVANLEAYPVLRD